MTWQRMAQIGLELAVCAVHPVPGQYYFIWTTKVANHGGDIRTEVSTGLQCNTFSPFTLSSPNTFTTTFPLIPVFA